MKKQAVFLLLLSALLTSQPVQAVKYTLEGQTDSVIGDLSTTYSRHEDTLLDIARAHGLGYQDIKLVNPGVDTWLPGEGMKINLPLQFVLPNTRKKGIVLNIPEMRLYYFPDASRQVEDGTVFTYPLGVGREGWATPYMKTRIIEKKKNPKWYPPESIRIEHEEAGDPLPEVVEAGPDNPLGDFAMRLGMPEYLIHGTNKPFGIGMRVSHGCIRLYPEDIEHLFEQVSVGTRVEIINQPFKVGERKGVLYLEAHPHLEEDAEAFSEVEAVNRMVEDYNHDQRFEINWSLVKKTVSTTAGVPVPIGMLKAETEDPTLQVAENLVIEETEEEVEAVRKPRIVMPRKVSNTLKPKKNDAQLNLRMETEINAAQ